MYTLFATIQDMNTADQKKLVDYWKKTAEHDYETMQGLFQIKRYDACLFFGHIVLEKTLKALVAHVIGDHAPYTHNLIRLAELANMKLSEEETEFLREVNTFNMEARYPEEKLAFYQCCTPEYTETYQNKIDDFYKKLCHELKRKNR